MSDGTSGIEPLAFEIDAYRREIEASVRGSGEDERGAYLLLTDTVLYPGGGGQPEDRGTVGGFAVRELARCDDGLRHYLEVPSPSHLPDGDVAVVLDWDRRFDHMQQHTAQHLLTALAHVQLGRSTTSFHLGESQSDIELEGPDLPPAKVDELEELAADAVRASHPVRATWIPLSEYESRTDIRTRGLPDHHGGDVRLIEIEGVDLTACGGTHVSNTACIGSIKLLGTESMRGGTRLHWTSGKRLRARLGDREAQSAALRSTLGVANEELAEAAQQRVDQLKHARKRIRALEEELADSLVTSFLDQGEAVVTAHFDEKDGGFVRMLAGRFADHAKDEAALFTSAAEGGRFFALAVGSEARVPVDELGSKIAQTLDGRGGGRGQTFQGTAGSLAKRVEALEQLRRAVTS